MNSLRELLFTDWSLALIQAQIRTGWRRLAAWWLAEFRELWPEFVIARLDDRGKPVIWLQVAAEIIGVDVASPRGRGVHSGLLGRAGYSAAALDRHLSAIGRKRGDAVLGIVLPPAAFFHRTFNIPARARERIQAIARQELEHRTPFKADDIHLGMAIDPKQPDAQTLTIHQSIVRRDLVEATARDLDLALAEISFVAPPVQPDDPMAISISLRPAADPKASSARRVVLALVAAAAIASCADAALFWWTKESRIAATEARATTERGKALVVRGLEDEVARVQSTLHDLEVRRRLAPTTDVWRETSRVLPDNTWVTDWSRHNGSVSIAGFSTASTALVALFEQSPLFGEASLDAPITFDAVTGRERFSLIVRTRADAHLAQR